MSTPSSSDRFRKEKNSPVCHEQHESPVIRLLRITELGLVFESWRNFEVGTFIDFGMHVPGRPAGLAASEEFEGGLDHKPSFLSLEGFVVDCLPSTDRTAGSFQVTVMFSDLDAADRAILRELERCVVAQPPSPSPAAAMMSRHEMLMARLEESVGLN